MEPTEAISGPTVPSDCSVIDLIARGATIASTLKRVAEVSTAGSEVIPAKRSRSEDVSDAGASLEALQRDVLQVRVTRARRSCPSMLHFFGLESIYFATSLRIRTFVFVNVHIHVYRKMCPYRRPLVYIG